MSNKLFGSYTPNAQAHLIQTDPDATQTITGNLNVTGTLTAGSVIDGGTYTGNLEVDGDLTVTGDTEVVALTATGAADFQSFVNLQGAIDIAGSVGLSAAGFTMAAIARTATADGTGTGTIEDGPQQQFITVTSGNAAHIIILPTPTPGIEVKLYVGANGYELRTSSPTTIAINGGTGADAESAIPANTLVTMTCESATTWKGFQQTVDGTLAKVEVAA